MPAQIDHVVMVVENLDEATRSFTDLGFNVIEGGEHSFRKSRNVLITFQDGSYIEIIAFLEDGPKDDPWWQLLQKGEGWVDWCLYTESIDPLLAREIPGAKGPVDGGRITPDGDRIEWKTVRFPIDEDVKLPFVIEDITERSLRIPGGAAAVHPNGVVGIHRVSTPVNDLDAASTRLANLLGQPVQAEFENRRSFALNAHTLDLFVPESEEGNAAELLKLRGPLPHEVVFAVRSETGVDAAGTSIVHGARISFVRE